MPVTLLFSCPFFILLFKDLHNRVVRKQGTSFLANKHSSTYSFLVPVFYVPPPLPLSPRTNNFKNWLYVFFFPTIRQRSSLV